MTSLRIMPTSSKRGYRRRKRKSPRKTEHPLHHLLRDLYHPVDSVPRTLEVQYLRGEEHLLRLHRQDAELVQMHPQLHDKTPHRLLRLLRLLSLLSLVSVSLHLSRKPENLWATLVRRNTTEGEQIPTLPIPVHHHLRDHQRLQWKMRNHHKDQDFQFHLPCHRLTMGHPQLQQEDQCLHLLQLETIYRLQSETFLLPRAYQAWRQKQMECTQRTRVLLRRLHCLLRITHLMLRLHHH